MKLLTVFLLFLAVPVSAAKLTETEVRIAAIVDGDIDAALVLLQQTVDINSGTMNFEGVEAVGRAFAPAFTALGFSVDWQDGARRRSLALQTTRLSQTL